MQIQRNTTKLVQLGLGLQVERNQQLIKSTFVEVKAYHYGVLIQIL